jgi:hypothetical protein
LLEERFNPNIVDVLADQAELARHEWLWMESELKLRSLEPGTLEPGTLSLDVATLQQTPLAIRRFSVWKAMTRIAGARPVSFEHVEAAVQLIVVQLLDRGVRRSRSNRATNRRTARLNRKSRQKHSGTRGADVPLSTLSAGRSASSGSGMHRYGTVG